MAILKNQIFPILEDVLLLFENFVFYTAKPQSAQRSMFRSASFAPLR